MEADFEFMATVKVSRAGEDTFTDTVGVADTLQGAIDLLNAYNEEYDMVSEQLDWTIGETSASCTTFEDGEIWWRVKRIPRNQQIK